MSHSTTALSDKGYLSHELLCYLQTDAVEIILANMHSLECTYDAHYQARQYFYQLPLGKLSLCEITLHLPADSRLADIKIARIETLKAAITWHTMYLSQDKDNEAASHDVLVFDIQFTDQGKASHKSDKYDQANKNLRRFKHGFAARYFMEDLVVDITDNLRRLQVFSWHDWQSILTTLQTPSELWRFLDYHLEQLDYSASSHVTSFETEEALVTQFLQSPLLFAPAISVDNALIKYNIQDEPNPALVAMALAYKSQSTTAQMYHQHMAQAAIVWSQLSTQMIETFEEKQSDRDDNVPSRVESADWQQQLLDESLFSRHELIRTLYKHPKQSPRLQQNGYVVHQHSYESLGRHYVLIFYGQDLEGQNSKEVIQPNLAKIAQDTATRLPIAELHHIIVLGIDFVTEVDETFIDIDVWIQPVDAMSQRERQLTKQIQQFKQQNLQQRHSVQQSSMQKSIEPQNTQQSNEQVETRSVKAHKNFENKHSPEGLPKVHLNLFIPARKNKT